MPFCLIIIYWVAGHPFYFPPSHVVSGRARTATNGAYYETLITVR